MNVQLLVMIALSPEPFRQAITKDGPLTDDQSWLVEIVESARHEKFVRMVTTAVDQAETDDRVGITDALLKLFTIAIPEQKRMLLKITGSYSLRAQWLKSLDTKVAVALVRNKDNGVWQIDYELMQLCSEEQQEQIIANMSTIDRTKFDLLQNKKELGMSDRNFAFFC